MRAGSDADRIGSDRIGSARLLHQSHNLRQAGVLAHARGPHVKQALQIHRPARDRVPRPLGHRRRLSRDHGLVAVAGAPHDAAVGGNARAGQHAQQVAALDERGVDHLAVRLSAQGVRGGAIAVAAQQDGGGGRQAQQLGDGIARAPLEGKKMQEITAGAGAGAVRVPWPAS